MSGTSNLFERPKNIKAKRTKTGSKNPRYVTAVRMQKETKQMYSELEFTVFSKARIAREYTPDRIADLLQRATANLKNMTMPSVRPPWMPQE